jgi:hypothetical protein
MGNSLRLFNLKLCEGSWKHSRVFDRETFSTFFIPVEWSRLFCEIFSDIFLRKMPRPKKFRRYVRRHDM